MYHCWKSRAGDFQMISVFEVGEVWVKLASAFCCVHALVRVLAWGFSACGRGRALLDRQPLGCVNVFACWVSKSPEMETGE